MRPLFRKKPRQHWLHRMHARPSSAVIILENDAGKALIVKANYKPYWTFPGGVIDANETPKQAAVRELAEEVGLPVASDLVRFGWVVARHSVAVDTYQFVFKARLQPEQENAIVLQASEIDEWKLVSKADVLSNDAHYAKAIMLWARDNTEGYVEQTFGANS